ncbi:hypothetical protein B0H13DRAFT_2301589 [Mycena leptocephala]|nr:hypothetical protein B0H13DRAFT_2301589 [Mycena leptocephala]
MGDRVVLMYYSYLNILEPVNREYLAAKTLERPAPHTPPHDNDDSHPPAARPWYQPSLPVLLALAPPIGNWLTGGDHLKDLLLLLLLVFYVHQLIEGVSMGPLPRRPTSSHAVPSRRRRTPLSAARAKSELRTIELLLLLVCLLAPVLGVVLRSLACPASWMRAGRKNMASR